MYRHLFRKPTVFSRYLIKEFQNRRVEELGFRYAALAKLRENTKDFKKEWERLHTLDVYENWEISRISILSQIYQLLCPLHQATRKEHIIRYPQLESIQKLNAILDPNTFPIQELVEKIHKQQALSIWKLESKNELSIYESVRNEVKEKVGFWLEVKKSQIDHTEAGNGVFLKLEHGRKSIPPGTLLGFVPGVIYHSYQELDSLHNKQPSDMHCCRQDGAIINFEEKLYHPLMPGWGIFDYEEKIEKLNELAKISRHSYNKKDGGGFQKVSGSDINPFAVGHFINHTPVNQSTNVCLIDIFIPHTFFPNDFMRFWPFQYFQQKQNMFDVFGHRHEIFREYEKNKFLRGLGVISVQEIKDNEELYLDYLDSWMFEIEKNPPDWLIKPPPLSPEITKELNLEKYENQIGQYQQMLEMYLFMKTKEGQIWEEFVKRINYEKQFID